MKFAVLGAGALGCVYGGMLAETGHDVTLVARGEHYAAMKQDGLTIETSEGSIKPRLRVAENLQDVSEADVAFVTVKARDTRKILERSKHLFGRTVFVSFQNSADKDDILTEYVGRANVIGGVSIVGATLFRPGIVEYTAAGKTWLGELPQGRSERVERLANVLNDAKLPTDVADNITAVKWVKLVQFFAAAGLSALTRLKFGQISQDEKLMEIFFRIAREGGRVMKAAGIEPEDYRKLIPLRKIMELPDDILIQEYLRRAKERLPTNVTVSMLQDVLKGKPLEIEETMGYLMNKAREFQVEAPTMQTVYALVEGLNYSISGTSSDSRT